MAARRYIDVFEAYERFSNGPKVAEDTWDYQIIPQKAKMLKDCYDIDFGNDIIPTDVEMIDRLFLAGMDMLLSCGIYNHDMNRVLLLEEEEIYEGLKMAPKKLYLGNGKDKIKCKPRKGNEIRMPVILGGPTGAPITENLFETVIKSYAQEPMVNGIVSGIIDSIDGRQAAPHTPWEIKATMAEIRHVREATSMSGRPGMCI